jgi:hypothetical protein
MGIIDFVKGHLQNMKDDRIAIRNMTEAELKEKALQTDSGILDGWNKYEKELIRRAKNEGLLEKKLEEIRQAKVK